MKLVLPVLAVVFLVIGCEKTNAPTGADEKTSAGALYFTFDKTNAPAAVKTLTTTLTRSGYSPLQKTIDIVSDTSASILFEQIAIGTWKVQVDAKNENGQVLYTGQSEVIVLENSVSIVNLVLSAVSTGVGSVQINVTWGASQRTIFPKTFGGPGQDFALSAVQTYDGGYILCGITHSFGTGGDAWIVKTNANGELLWSKNYGGSGEDRFNNIIQTSDGGYLAIGYTTGSDEDSWLMKLDSIGTKIWEKKNESAGDDEYLIIKKAINGSYVISGFARNSAYYDFDGVVANISPSGDILWKKKMGGAGGDFAMNLIPLSDGNIMVSGYNGSDFSKHYDVWAWKLNSSGSLLWEKFYGDSLEERSAGLVQTNDGNFMISGHKVINGLSYGMILKINPEGTILWRKYFGNNGEDLLKMEEASDNTILVSGYNTVSGFGQQGVLMKINNSGDLLWNKSFGGTGRELFCEVHPTSDNKFIISGTTSSTGNGMEDLWLIKVDGNGTIQ